MVLDRDVETAVWQAKVFTHEFVICKHQKARKLELPNTGPRETEAPSGSGKPKGLLKRDRTCHSLIYDQHHEGRVPLAFVRVEKASSAVCCNPTSPRILRGREVLPARFAFALMLED